MAGVLPVNFKNEEERKKEKEELRALIMEIVAYLREAKGFE